MQPEEATLADATEIKTSYVDFNPVRPIIYKIHDHLKVLYGV